MSTLILDAPRTSALSQGWIISKREDLTWFIGSSLLGYVAFAGLLAGLPAMTAFLVWKFAVDGPHVFATASRTYFDKQARGKLGWRLWLIVPLVLIGPAMWAIGFGWLFVTLLLTWAQYHIAKQHVGFVMLYKRKTRERDDFLLDRRFTVISLMLPWALFLYLQAGLPVLAAQIATALYIGVAMFYAAHQLRKTELNIPKLLLLSVIIPLHWIALLYAAGKPDGIIIAGIATNLGHSFQYHRLTWFHNRNRYLDPARFGFTSTMSSRLAIYAVVAITLNIMFWAVPFIAFAGNAVLLASLAGMNMTHYYLDSKIWRTRDDKELAAALQL